MRKLLLLLTSFCLFSPALWARSVDLSASYIGGSDADQIKFGAEMPLSLNSVLGIEAKYLKDKFLSDNINHFKDPAYALALPVRFNFDFIKINLKPFVYLKNKSNNSAFQDASAYGISSRFLMTLQDDVVNDLYAHAFIGVSYAKQKGTLFTEEGASNQDFSQMAYTLGLHKNFYRAFSFEVAGNAFQYPDGITGVTAFRGVMDQQDLAQMYSYDIVRDLPKYTVGMRLSRLWEENLSSLYLSYRFGEFYTADSEHSAIIGNSFMVLKNLTADIGYNHIRTIHNENKRDIFYINLAVSF